MTEKRKKAKKDEKEKDGPHVLQVKGEEGKTTEQRLAKLVLQPEVKATATIRMQTTGFGATDVTELLKIVESNAAEIVKGDVSLVERHLVAQAMTLDTLFHSLLSKTTGSMSLELYKVYMSLALKAQSQSRTTWETLALVKNPPPYIRQQNVALNQQVNNGAAGLGQRLDEGIARAEENSKSTNGLLSDKRGEYETLDTRGTATAGRTDKELEAVATLNRPEDGGGEG